MRRWMLSLVALSLIVSMVGCRHAHSHGVFDCEHDDHCSTRSPWIRMAPAAEQAPTPMKLPAVKTGLE